MIKNIKTVLLIFTVSLFIFNSCGNSGQISDLPDISQANRIKLSFKSDFDTGGKMKIIYKNLTDSKSVIEIKKIIRYEPFDYIYCASTGSMEFFKDSTLITEMVFNTTPDLKHIACNYNGKLVAIKLSEENAKLIDNFKN